MSDESTLLETLAKIAGGVIVGAGAVAEFFRRRNLQQSKDSVEIAENDRDRTVANADQRSIQGLIARVEWLEEESRRNHHEMAAMRRQFRHAEDHIAKLERALSAAGIQFVPYEPLRLDPAA